MTMIIQQGRVRVRAEMGVIIDDSQEVALRQLMVQQLDDAREQDDPAMIGALMEDSDGGYTPVFAAEEIDFQEDDEDYE